MRKVYKTGDVIINMVIYSSLVILMLLILVPSIHVVAASFSSAKVLIQGKVTFLPVDFTLVSYKAIMNHPALLLSYANSAFYSVFGTLVSVALVIMLAYPLSRPGLPGGKGIMKVLFFTMLFNGGLIPTYLVCSWLGMPNDRFKFLLLPHALGIFYVIISRTFFKTIISQELYDSAEIDGATSLRTLVSIVLPLSKSLIAVLSLWHVVGNWNTYFPALIYLNDRSLQPLQIILREILVMNQFDANMTDVSDIIELENIMMTLKYASIVVASLPLLIAYPFAQKHFVKGVMIGSIKG